MNETDRNHIRIKMDTRIFVEAVAAPDSSEGLLLQCKVIDISYSGFRVRSDNELTVGAILSVCVELPAVQEPFYMAAEVIWCQPDSDGHGWLIGFEALKSSDTDIDAWRELLEHI